MSEQHVVTCTVCPNGCEITVTVENGQAVSVSGNRCKRGEPYAKAEVVNPVRTLTALVRLNGGECAMCPVKTSRPVFKKDLKALAEKALSITVDAPVRCGDVLVSDFDGNGADLLAARSIGAKG